MMKGIIAAIDSIIDVVAAVTGIRPEAGFWTTAERITIAVIGIGLVALLALALGG
jgi:hypothetical protein